MQALSQRDPRWKNLQLGTSSATIGSHGCTITCIAMILGTTPDVVNERILAVNGYAEGNLVIWAKLEEAFPGIKVKRVWSYDNADVLKNVPNVLVEVDGKPIGGFRHWVVYIGNKKCIDPWDGNEDPTSDYPDPLSYCVIGGKWNKPSPVTDTVAVEKSVFENLVRKSTIADKVREKLNCEDSETIIVAEIEKLIKYEDAVREKEGQLAEAGEEIKKLKADLEKVTEVHEKEVERNEKLELQVKEQKKTIFEQGVSITQLAEKLKKLENSITMPILTGWKKIVVELIAKI